MSKKSSLSGKGQRGWGSSSKPGLSGFRKKQEQGNQPTKSGLSDSKNEQGLTFSTSTRSAKDVTVDLINIFTKLDLKQQKYLDGRSSSKGLKSFLKCVSDNLPLAQELLKEAQSQLIFRRPRGSLLLLLRPLEMKSCLQIPQIPTFGPTKKSKLGPGLLRIPMKKMMVEPQK